VEENPPTPFTKGAREGGMTGGEREVFLLRWIWYKKFRHGNRNENVIVTMMAGE